MPAPCTPAGLPAPEQVRHVFHALAPRCQPPVGRQWAANWVGLNAEERVRAGRFTLEQARARFVSRRARLRELLGQQLALPADAVVLRPGPPRQVSLATDVGAAIQSQPE